MAAELEDALGAELAAWEARGLTRRIEISARATDAGEFVSNDYLGLSQHESLIEAACRAARDFGAGGRASRLLGGGSELDTQTERACADWMGAENALLFPTGYQANMGLVTSLAGRGDAIFSDTFNHASLIDASRLSRAEIFVHRHVDVEQLETQLSQARGARRRIVITEGVFSMDGDASPLAEISEVCAQHDAWLIVDEAHAVGLLGAEGSGAWRAALDAGADPSPLVARVLTGGKALGAGGALVVGSSTLREHLIQRARTFLFTTGLPPAVSGALRCGIELSRDVDDRRATTLNHAKQIARGLSLPEPAAAIVPFVVGENERAVRMAQELSEHRVEVRSVRPPTVPVGTARLRISTHSYNSEEAVRTLITKLATADSLRETKIPVSRRAVPNVLNRRSPTLVVAGTDTDVGKTIVSALLLKAAARRGPALYWKPVQTGNDSDTNTIRSLVQTANAEFSSPCYEFPLPASPHAAAADVGKSIQMPFLDQALRRERTRRTEGRLVIELAGGLLVPLTSEATQLDWLAGHRLPHVLVARSGLGTLNHTLLSLEALRARGIYPEALFLVGRRHPSNRATLEQMSGVPLIYELPLFETLNSQALDHWLDENDLGPLHARGLATERSENFT